MATPTELVRAGSLAYIYKDKMFTFGGYDENGYSYDVWCLDLSIDFASIRPI